MEELPWCGRDSITQLDATMNQRHKDKDYLPVHDKIVALVPGTAGPVFTTWSGRIQVQVARMTTTRFPQYSEMIWSVGRT